MPIITTQRACELVPQFDSADVQVMTDIVNAASGIIEKYCNRTFSVTAYDQLIDGTGHQNILLDQYPVTQLDRLMFNPVPVLSIGNRKNTVSRASFRLDSTSLYLVSAAAGVVTTRTITRASHLTLADLATAVNAYSADGWEASSMGVYSNISTADLYAPQGGLEVRWTGYGYMWHHTFGVPALMGNPAIGEVVSSFGFQRGYQNYRCLYSAGFSVVPYEIQQAVAELAAAVYQNRDVNVNLQSENLGGYSYTQIAQKSFDNVSIASKYALSQYRNLRIPKYKTW